MKYRIEPKYPCYINGGCLPTTGYFVQVQHEGLFGGRWIDVKGYGSKANAIKLLEILKK